VENYNERPIREGGKAIATRRSGEGVEPMFECTFVRLRSPSRDTNHLFRVVPRRN